MAQTKLLGKWFHRWLRPWRGIDWLLLICPVGITLFSSLLIASTRLYTGETDLAWNHIIMGVLGVILSMWIARSRYETLLEWRWVIYLITNVSLVAVMLIGTVGNGAQSWISNWWL